jgi:hypothetical protein
MPRAKASWRPSCLVTTVAAPTIGLPRYVKCHVVAFVVSVLIARLTDNTRVIANLACAALHNNSKQHNAVDEREMGA